MRIKICGITRVEDARAASQTGADFVGLNFYPDSVRYAGDGSAEPLIAGIEAPAVPVAVTVNPSKKLLGQLIAPGPRVGARPFRVVQLHGDEPPALADWLITQGARVIKAFRVADCDFAGPIREWLDGVEQHAGLLAVLLDAPPPAPRKFGGSGRRFNWEWVEDAREDGQFENWPSIMLAGGLTPANVAKAIRLTRPWGVDTAGGVEVEDSPGVKSIDRIRDFIRNARVG
ncbi:MAG: phosphoribosylanthranilate isomerase [Phycisphaerae bacterium]|nr:phosphoribosylanthranilate isomerase [Phycisphaerae bacterium]